MRTNLRFGVIASAIAIVATACGGTEETSPEGTAPTETTTTAEPELGGSIVVSNWDLYLPPKVVNRFEKATGVEVEYVNHTTNEDIMGKITAQNGSGFDVVFVSGPFVQALVGQGWAAEIDHSQIPNMANLYPEANELGYDPGNTHSVPYAWGTTGICYRSDLVDEAPSSWEIFHSPPPDLVDKMTMLGTDRWLLQPALLSDGVSINSTDPDQIDAATQWTVEAKQNLLALDDTKFYKKLDSGEASLVQAWDGWCNYASNENVEFVLPDEGSDVWTDTMVILESSQNKAAAHAFINWILEPENAAAVTEYVYYKTPNEPGMELVDPALYEAYPNLAMSPAELLEQEPELDLGPEGTILWADAATEVKAS
jgi:spermidine/putrescine transport system substrate-binding protein